MIVSCYVWLQNFTKHTYIPRSNEPLRYHRQDCYITCFHIWHRPNSIPNPTMFLNQNPRYSSTLPLPSLNPHPPSSMSLFLWVADIRMCNTELHNEMKHFDWPSCPLLPSYTKCVYTYTFWHFCAMTCSLGGVESLKMHIFIGRQAPKDVRITTQNINHQQHHPRNSWHIITAFQIVWMNYET